MAALKQAGLGAILASYPESNLSLGRAFLVSLLGAACKVASTQPPAFNPLLAKLGGHIEVGWVRGFIGILS